MSKGGKRSKTLDPKGDTVWMGVVDKDGNSVSLIQSIYHDYGSGIVAANTGVLLQNRGSFFSLDPNHVNHLEPRKRTFHTLNPAMLRLETLSCLRNNGRRRTTANPSRPCYCIVDFGFSVQDAIEAPRWLNGRLGEPLLTTSRLKDECQKL